MKNSLNYNIAMKIGNLAKFIDNIGFYFFNKALNNYKKKSK